MNAFHSYRRDCVAACVRSMWKQLRTPPIVFIEIEMNNKYLRLLRESVMEIVHKMNTQTIHIHTDTHT